MKYRSFPPSSSRKFKALSLLLLASAIASPLPAQTIFINRPVSDSLTPTGFYWNFDDWDSQGRVVDRSGNGITGTLTASAHTIPIEPQVVGGRFGQAVGMVPGIDSATIRDVAVNGNAGSGSDAAALDFYQTSFTGGLWFFLDNLTDTGGAQEVYLIGRGIPASNENFISFHMIRWKDQPSNWSLRLSLGKVGEASVLLSATALANLPLDEWNHLGFTFEYGETESMVTFQVNGVKVGESVSTGFALAKTSTADHRRLRVGERGVGTFYGVLDGRIDEAFLTEGAYSFSAEPIPEPTLGALLLVGGAGLFFSRRRLFARLRNS